MGTNNILLLSSHCHIKFNSSSVSFIIFTTIPHTRVDTCWTNKWAVLCMTTKTLACPSWLVCRPKHYTQGILKTNWYFWNYCGNQLHYPKFVWTSGSYPLLLNHVLWYPSFCKLYFQVIHRLIKVWELLPCCSLIGFKPISLECCAHPLCDLRSLISTQAFRDVCSYSWAPRSYSSNTGWMNCE